MQRVIIALPCYNEAANLPALLNTYVQLHEFVASSYRLEIVVIDDCSKDPTQEAIKPYLEKNFITAILHEKNKGLTGGINTSFDLFHAEVQKDENVIACGLCVFLTFGTKWENLS